MYERTEFCYRTLREINRDGVCGCIGVFLSISTPGGKGITALSIKPAIDLFCKRF